MGIALLDMRILGVSFFHTGHIKKGLPKCVVEAKTFQLVYWFHSLEIYFDITRLNAKILIFLEKINTCMLNKLIILKKHVSKTVLNFKKDCQASADVLYNNIGSFSLSLLLNLLSLLLIPGKALKLMIIIALRAKKIEASMNNMVYE